MGKNNRHRRAAKARQRSRQHTRHQHPPPRGDHQGSASDAGFGRSEPLAATPADRFVAAAYAARTGDDASVALLVEVLAAEGPRTVAAEIATVLEHQVRWSWAHGWQPIDLDRWVTRELGKAEVALARVVIAAEAVSYQDLGARVAPGWMAQLERIGAIRAWDQRRPYLLQTGDAWPEALLVAVRLMELLMRLPVLPCLTEPPSAWRAGATVSSGALPADVLAKVRALLAKAESTAFDAEAEAFTAKAQELMARHRIDRAVLEASGQPGEGGEEPVGRRIGIDDPYADAKAALLGGIARANGCRAVWSKDLGFMTVFGFAGELAAVEELFTSLLVQATSALRREGSKVDHSGRSRTTRFRRSFLVAFAVRIGQRLRDAVDATVAAATTETGTALVPILAARDEAANAAAEAAFPEMEAFSPSATDGEGWYAGTLFGDQADLALGPELVRRSA